MLNEQQELFDRAFSDLKNKDINGFVSKIIDLHNILTCNCFLNSQKDDVFPEMLNYINEYPDNKQDIILNLSKGFIFLKNKNIEKAYSYLLDVISIEKTNDLALSLLSSIDIKINPDCLNHSKLAVSLNPTARNYSLLASNYDYKSEKQNEIESNFENGITFYKKALELNSDFACAHNNLGVIYEKLKEYELAIIEYQFCIGLEINHWAYRMLWKCLIEIRKYSEALEIAKKGFKIHPEEKEYFFKLGYTYSLMNYKFSAQYYYKKYLKIFPDKKTAKKNLEICEGIKIFDSCSIGFLDDKIFDDFKEFFEANNPQKCIDESNPIFVKLNNLNNSYINKKRIGEVPTNKEEFAFNYKIFNCKTVFRFGIYKGVTLEDLLKKDPKYIIWCIINLKNFVIMESSISNENLVKQSDYFKAFEYFLIKHLIIRKREAEKAAYNAERYPDDNESTNRPLREIDYGPSAYGYNSWEEMTYWEVFEGNDFEYGEFLDQ